MTDSRNLRRPFLTEKEALAELGQASGWPAHIAAWQTFCRQQQIYVHEIAGARLLDRAKFYDAVARLLRRCDDAAKNHERSTLAFSSESQP